MEVDDAVSSPPVEKVAENGRTTQNCNRRAGVVLKKIPQAVLENLSEKAGGFLKSPNEEKIKEGIELEDDVKSSVSTSFKLEVSEDEDSQDGVVRLSALDSEETRSVSRNQKEKSLKSDAEEEDVRRELKVFASEIGGNSVPLKRKRYEFRRSGSEECLLGFDELSGEAELVKDDSKTLLKTSIERMRETSKEKKPNAVSVGKKSKQVIAAKTTHKLEGSNMMNLSAPLNSSVNAEQGKRSIDYEKHDSNEKMNENSKSHIVADAEDISNDTKGTQITMSGSSSRSVSAGLSGTKKPMSPQDDYYKKPFEYGWKRELVWRANMETSKDKADVYFITPGGKKLRARSDIIPLLEGDLTIEHFSFAREPLGVSPEFETVRNAKPSSRLSITAATLAAASTPTNMGKRISKPKGPKGASPPPQGWTPTRALKVNNAALLSSGSRHGGGSSNLGTPINSRGGGGGTSTNTASSKSSKAAKRHANDIENDLKQIKESINNIRKPQLSADGTSIQHGVPLMSTHAAVEHSNKLFATNFFANVSFAYEALLCILKYLKIHERPRAASVCKLWHLAAKDTSLWHTVRMKNSKVCNWSGFAAALRRGETKHLDLRKMLLTSTRSEEMWQDFSRYIGTVYSLEVIDLCRCSARVVESLFESNENLRVLNAIAINDEVINLKHIDKLKKLEELRLRTCEPGIISDDGLQPLEGLTKLTHLSLTGFRVLGTLGNTEVFVKMTGLRSLELGECGQIDSKFGDDVLPKLKHLQRLRLENGQETGCCTLKILEAVSQLEQLSQLELVNFDIKPNFDERLQKCTNIRKLLIIPTYISQSATTNHIVLSAVQKVSETLRVFTWGVTVELLRVTALYVDQCEESTKKQKHHFDECIPVLKPVPGAPNDESESSGVDKEHNSDSQKRTDEDTPANEMPQIEILPLDKVESILGENLPHTKYTIVKVPYHATCKQQLVD